ncbi:hypothetical protein P280DRAFT_517942 [Massarina eburnea CBS 473.64]|uniref:Uncharacterized protein n=1 Tax=Massarina eburnea CBS 473.64 TaxID=1395130 RepID=A0A6A6S2V7_9PLEO|nr:hypothetical protein P280DRAFT_517942 [Massarina eburnea CBS 473.64]
MAFFPYDIFVGVFLQSLINLTVLPHQTLPFNPKSSGQSSNSTLTNGTATAFKPTITSTTVAVTAMTPAFDPSISLLELKFFFYGMLYMSIICFLAGYAIAISIYKRWENDMKEFHKSNSDLIIHLKASNTELKTFIQQYILSKKGNADGDLDLAEQYNDVRIQLREFLVRHQLHFSQCRQCKTTKG